MFQVVCERGLEGIVAKRSASLYRPGQPRLVKTPMEPFGPEELAEVERALAKGLIPPH